MRGEDLSDSILIEEGERSRRVAADSLPISIGGDGADIRVPDGADGPPEAYIAADGEDLFVQPANASGRLRCNGDAVTTSQWLHDGDVLGLGRARIAVSLRENGARLTVETEEAPAVGPILKPPPRPGAAATEAGSDASGPGAGGAEARGASAMGRSEMIVPVDFSPRSLAAAGRRRGTVRWALALTWILLAVLAATAWFTFTARTVELSIEPAPDHLAIRGPMPRLGFAGRHLLRPGTYTVVAEKEGYRRLETDLVVNEASHQVHELALELLPGLLVVSTDPAEGVAIALGGEQIGTTPLEPVELEAGEYTVTASTDRYRTASETVTIGGAGSRAEVTLTLPPLWAPVSFASTPPGARLRVEGEERGRTPVTVDLIEGRHAFELRLEGHKPYRGEVQVVAGSPLSVEAPTLEPVDGWLSLTSEPDGAKVTIDGVYRGTTPLELEMAPGTEHRVSASLGGHRGAERSFSIGSGQTMEVHLELEPELGEVEIEALPADAELWIDGVARGRAGQTLTLPAVPHQVEVRKEGFETVAREVTPRPGFPQTLSFVLTSREEAEEQAAAELNPAVLETSQGQALRLIQPGRFQMGASRREPGRRANEALREVEITRPFYLATEEVSNKEFSEYRSHNAGAAGGTSLDLDDYPVVQVTWEDAARYCNWLSIRESLDPYYVERGGTLVAADPWGVGYRLPTEAEWAWAARYAGREEAVKYPWGDSLPVTPGSGNYADASAAAILPATLSGYNDGFPTTAPVDSFDPNPLGLYNLGGNVAEWMHDVYSIYSSAAGAVEQDPRGPEEGDYHVIRGAGWMNSTVTELRLTYRDYGNEGRPDVGFRIARNANPTPSGDDPRGEGN